MAVSKKSFLAQIERKRQRDKDMLSCFFWTLSSLGVTPGRDAVILPEKEANKWQRAESRESHRRKSNTLKNATLGTLVSTYPLLNEVI